MSRLRVAVLESSYEQSGSVFRDVDGFGDPADYLAAYAHERIGLHKRTAEQQILELVPRGFDVFLNLCDGAQDEDRAGTEVAALLERLGLPFTGARASFAEPTRAEMRAAGVRMPPGVRLGSEAELHRASHLRFPLIVKHPESYGSIGLTPASCVRSASELEVEVRRILSLFGGALVEEFIEGRELTVLVAEDPDLPAPRVYHPFEYAFSEGETFKHFDLKWVYPERFTLARCRDTEIATQAIDLTRRLFVAMNGSGYARCDFRVNAAGEIYLLEINPNCGVFCPDDDPAAADVILAGEPGGRAGFIDLIFRAARARQR